MKILYSAGNRAGSYYQLKRFLSSIANKNYNIKIAAYKLSIDDLNVDYTLDCLLNFCNPDKTISFNGNYSYYKNEVKRFNPDLIISDFEIYTSILANELNIKLWQVSPINIYYALDAKTKQAVAIHKYNYHLIEANIGKVQHIADVFARSDRKLVLSHLCDCENAPKLIDGFQWVRPEFILGENINRNQNLIVMSKTNKSIMREFNKSTVLFSPNPIEKYNEIRIENINNETAYKNELEDCGKFITDGTETFLADAFYNCKYSYAIPRHDDLETIIGAYMNAYCNIGSIGLDGKEKKIDIKIDEGVKFLSEHLEQL